MAPRSASTARERQTHGTKVRRFSDIPGAGKDGARGTTPGRLTGRTHTMDGLHVVHVIDSLTSGGAESSLAIMAPELVRKGVRLDVVALKTRPGVRDALVEGGAHVIELEGTRATWWYS